MDTSMVKGIMIGAVAISAAAAVGVTGYDAFRKSSYADVLAVKEVQETVKTPRHECSDVAVNRRAPVSDQNRIAGTAIGAVAGGLLGSTIGRGSGHTLATVAGAVGGGYAGNQVQKQMQDRDVQTTTERHCKTVYDTSAKVVGYDVTYRLRGKEGVVRMSHDPGTKIPVKNGSLVLDAEMPS
jgi:uncharacterized protein YcfJ